MKLILVYNTLHNCDECQLVLFQLTKARIKQYFGK